ncbi:MAG: hypothetical protein DRP46_02060 [Candidatus Zixiibacteriota bacterium]|nr:MAG: hypothetical protein DRP46_02060 [candidate division Zixibacteria bacterium]HDL04296.1 hypothetical protein [candidate division Zixibacteria bacterium]
MGKLPLEGKMLRKIVSYAIITGVLMVTAQTGFGQGTTYFGDSEPAKSLYEIPPRVLVDAPTAGTLPRGCFDIVMRVYNNGGILGKTSIGLSNRLMLGMSYGAEDVISDYTANANPEIEFNIKLRLIDEDYYLPALAIGFNSQGYGAWIKDRDRYTYKSKGFYGVVSRSFMLQSMNAGIHAGVNYSFEYDQDDEKDPTFFFGFDSRFQYNIGFYLEYDLALNDDKSSAGYAKGRGYLNAGLKWMYSENLELEFVVKDLLQNRRQDSSTFGRELRFTYIEFF